MSYNRNEFEIEVDPSSTIEDLKGRLAIITGVPAHRQRLACKGTMLNGGKRLQDTKVSDGCKVNVSYITCYYRIIKNSIIK